MKQLLISLLFFFAVNAFAFDPAKENVRVLDVWECGKELRCAIVLHEDGRFLLAVADKKGVRTVLHQGKVIYERDRV